MKAHYCIDTQYSGWSKSQSANEDEARYSGLASICLVEDDLLESQLSLGTPTSLLRYKVVSKSLQLFSSLLALQGQHASSEYAIISALTKIQDDKPEENLEKEPFKEV